MTVNLKKTHALEKSNKDLEQFSYIASHDLKSPLNAIAKISSWIEEDCRTFCLRNQNNTLIC